MNHTIRWPDGVTWHADAKVFDGVTAALASVTGVIEGLAPVLARWRAEAQRGPVLEVDAFAPSESDRAVLTAALARAVDELRAGAGSDDEGRAAVVQSTAELHELFVTDITKS